MPHFDRQDQFDKVMSGLIAGEQIEAVFDCTGVGTGFVGITDKRVVLQDNSFVGKKTAITSLPYTRVQSVSFISDKSMFGSFVSSSTIAIRTSGGSHEATFRGVDKAKYIHDYVLYKIT